jgi:hypothetical protein
MPPPTPAVRNAADPRQVRLGEQIDRRRRERFERSLASVLSTAEGRVVLAALVRRAGVYQSPFNQHGGIQSFNIGRQDYGHELMADLIRVSPEAWQLLEREAWDWEKSIERDIDAGHTTRAGEGESDE